MEPGFPVDPRRQVRSRDGGIEQDSSARTTRGKARRVRIPLVDRGLGAKGAGFECR